MGKTIGPGRPEEKITRQPPEPKSGKLNQHRVTWLMIYDKISQFVNSIIGHERPKDIVLEREKKDTRLSKQADNLAKKIPAPYKVKFNKNDPLNLKMKTLERNLFNLRLFYMAAKQSNALKDSVADKFDKLVDEYNELAEDYNRMVAIKKQKGAKILQMEEAPETPSVAYDLQMPKIDQLEKKMIEAHLLTEPINQTNPKMKLMVLSQILIFERMDIEERGEPNEIDKFNELVKEIKNIKGIDLKPMPEEIE